MIQMGRAWSVLVLLAALTACAGPAPAKRVVYASLGAEPTLLECQAAVTAGLEAGGYELGRNLDLKRVVVDSPAEAAAAVSRIDAARPDLVITFTSTMLHAASMGLRHGQAVGVYCYDPVAAGAGKALDDHLPWVTAVGTPPPLVAVASLLRGLEPRPTKVGVVYNPREPGPKSQVAQMRLLLAGPRLQQPEMELVTVEIDQPQDSVPAVAQLLAKGVGAVWKVGDATVVRVAEDYCRAVSAAGLPLIGDHESQLAWGAVATASIDFRTAGREAGRIAALVLDGQTVDCIPMQRLDAWTIEINAARAQELGVGFAPPQANNP